MVLADGMENVILIIDEFDVCLELDQGSFPRRLHENSSWPTHEDVVRHSHLPGNKVGRQAAR